MRVRILAYQESLSGYGSLLVRELEAPAWTDPQALKHWFGPDEGKVSLAQTDVRVGGRFHVVFSTLDGEQHDVSGARPA